jgi:hypothetical protein
LKVISGDLFLLVKWDWKTFACSKLSLASDTSSSNMCS